MILVNKTMISKLGEIYQISGDPLISFCQWCQTENNFRELVFFFGRFYTVCPECQLTDKVQPSLINYGKDVIKTDLTQNISFGN